MPNDQGKQTEGQQEGAAKETDYKALWEQAKAEAEKWKAQSRKNESRAKANYGAAKDLEEVNQQVAVEQPPEIRPSFSFRANRSGVTPAWRSLKKRLGVETDDEVMAKIYESDPDIAEHPCDFASLSDIIHAASDGKVNLGIGHYHRFDVDGNIILDGNGKPVPYWDNTTRVIETWADYSASLVVNERESRLIQKLFPEETAIVDAMMEVMVQ